MTSGFEGDFDEVQVTDDGRAQRGSSDFNMTIAAANQGVILRRRFDQGIAGQNATVSVDGAVVGTWYRAGANLAVRTFPNGLPQYSFRWREDDFLIPSCFTAGKTSVHIKIQFVSSYVDWNEFPTRPSRCCDAAYPNLVIAAAGRKKTDHIPRTGASVRSRGQACEAYATFC